MPSVTFITRDNQRHEVTGAAGTSLMRLAVDNDVPGIEGECGGAMSCGTCHVFVRSPWAEQLRPASLDETDLLEFDENTTDASRLGCQITLSDALDGLVVEVAASA